MAQPVARARADVDVGLERATVVLPDDGAALAHALEVGLGAEGERPGALRYALLPARREVDVLEDIDERAASGHRLDRRLRRAVAIRRPALKLERTEAQSLALDRGHGPVVAPPWRHRHLPGQPRGRILERHGEVGIEIDALRPRLEAQRVQQCERLVAARARRVAAEDDEDVKSAVGVAEVKPVVVEWCRRVRTGHGVAVLGAVREREASRPVGETRPAEALEHGHERVAGTHALDRADRHVAAGPLERSHVTERARGQDLDRIGRHRRGQRL